MGHVFPEWKGKLPLSSRALIAWAKVNPGEEGGPIADFAIAALALDMLERGETVCALGRLPERTRLDSPAP